MKVGKNLDAKGKKRLGGAFIFRYTVYVCIISDVGLSNSMHKRDIDLFLVPRHMNLCGQYGGSLNAWCIGKLFLRDWDAKFGNLERSPRQYLVRY